jgi:gamma-glutamyl phosphate reductase
LNEIIIKKLTTGDYVGIYANRPDLDASHVGIAIWSGNKLLFRHASSKAQHRMVIDEDFMKYISNKPGIIVLRHK